MGERIRAFDWTVTPLGPFEAWPQSLRSALSICLNSSFPTAIYWGPDLRLLYNDAWSPIPAERHPGALGGRARDVWPDIWDVVGPQLERVLTTGEGFSTFDQMLPMLRDGSVQETYWNYSFTPIQGEDGAVVGIFNQGHETTPRVLAERRMAAETDWLKRLFEQAPGFMAILRGPDHVFELTNTAYHQLVGHRHVAGRPIREALPELVGQGYFERLDEVFESGEPVIGAGAPVELQRSAGEPVETRFVDFIYQPIRDERGEVSGIFVQGHDVTDQRLTQRALRERQEQLAAFISQSTAGFAQVDMRGNFTLVNDRFCEIAGRSRAQLLTLRMQDITHPDDLERNLPMFERAVADGTPYTHEKRYVRPDGSIVWVNNSVSVVRKEDGTPYGVLAITIDVTDRRRAEETIHENEARLRAITDNLPGGMVFQLGTGADGAERKFLYVSQSFEKLTGYSAERVKEDPLLPYKTILEEDVASLAAAEEAAVRSLRPFDFEARFRRADGEIRWGRIISAPRRQADGSVVWDGIKIDVTEHKRLESETHKLNETLEARVRERTDELDRVHEQLRQSQKLEAMGQLTGGVAHDFNNLLTPIIGSLDLLVRRSSASERERRMMSAALDSAERAKTLVQRLLAFARRQPLQPGPVDTAEVLIGMQDLLASTLGPRVRLELEATPDLLPALADRNQLEMSILNLCVNARDAMPEGGTLSIGLTDETVKQRHPAGLGHGRYLKLSVADSGTGMSEETRNRAIEPFYSTKGIGHGTGLGLSMVHGLVSQLGGGMTIRSKLGEGTTVDLFLPLVCHDASAPLANVDASPELGAQRGRVLLVDDELIVRESTAEMLRELGFEVDEAQDAAQALRLLEARLPDLVVTDHLMPRTTGAQLACLIRELDPSIPILIISGYAEIDDIPNSFARLGKPFRLPELATSLASLRTGANRLGASEETSLI